MFSASGKLSRLTVSVLRSPGRPAVRICLGDRFGTVVAGCQAPSGGRFYIVLLASGAPVAAAEGGDCPRCELGSAPESLRPSAGLSLWRQSSGESPVSQSSGVQGYMGAGCRRVSRPERGVGLPGLVDQHAVAPEARPVTHGDPPGVARVAGDTLPRPCRGPARALAA